MILIQYTFCPIQRISPWRSATCLFCVCATKKKKKSNIQYLHSSGSVNGTQTKWLRLSYTTLFKPIRGNSTTSASSSASAGYFQSSTSSPTRNTGAPWSERNVNTWEILSYQLGIKILPHILSFGLLHPGNISHWGYLIVKQQTLLVT